MATTLLIPAIEATVVRDSLTATVTRIMGDFSVAPGHVIDDFAAQLIDSLAGTAIDAVEP